MRKSKLFVVGVVIGALAVVGTGVYFASKSETVKNAVKGVTGGNSNDIDADELRAKIEEARKRIAAEMEKNKA